MAFHIRIEKTGETAAAVRYAFESALQGRGVLELDKQSGEARLIEPMPQDERLHCYQRAVVKVTREWRAGRLPQTLEWAS
jgi:hypothetical protein